MSTTYAGTCKRYSCLHILPIFLYSLYVSPGAIRLTESAGLKTCPDLENMPCPCLAKSSCQTIHFPSGRTKHVLSCLTSILLMQDVSCHARHVLPCGLDLSRLASQDMSCIARQEVLCLKSQAKRCLA